MTAKNMLQEVVTPDVDFANLEEMDLAYLLAEIERVEVYFRRRVVFLQSIRPTGSSGLVVTDDDISVLLESKATDTSTIDAEFAMLRSRKEATSAAILAEAESEPRLAVLYRAFNLSEFERNAFLICLAPLVDLRFERIFGYLQDDITVRRPTISTVLDLLVGEDATRFQLLPTFFDRGKLLVQRLLLPITEPGTQPSLLSRQLTVDETILAWLLGTYQPNAHLETALRFVLPQLEEKDYLLTSEIWPILSNAINGQTVASFHGTDWQVQLSTARRLALNADLPLLILDIGALPPVGEMTALDALRYSLRDARMTQSILLIRRWDLLTAQTPGYEQIVNLIFAHAAPVILCSEKEWYAHGAERSDAILRMAFQRPSYQQRIALWSHFIETSTYQFADNIEIKLLASQFALDSTQIVDAISSAQDVAIQRQDVIYHRDLVNASRIHSSPNLAGLARKIEPRYEWTDIVLPEDQRSMLREMIQTVRGRGIVMESWNVGAKLKTSSGVTVLFAGPPGTGKTMSAEVIAGELGLDLYKIDLSVVVSKYIGETEKNLGKIFDEAQSSSAVLFFDEADSIFGKRSEVKDSHDRYANMEISYLLQRMELYDGITILATNLRANMDEAFTRRMQFIVDFPFPDVEERIHIWKTLFPAELPRADDIDLPLLATRFKLAGGNIRNIIAGAAFLAAADGGAVTMDHLLHSTRRELQKMGRLISDMDLSF